MAKKNKAPAFWLCRNKHAYVQMDGSEPTQSHYRDGMWRACKNGEMVGWMADEEFVSRYPQHKLEPGTKKRVRIDIQDY